MRKFLLAMAGLGLMCAAPANATTVFIDSTVSGCSSGGGACGNGVQNLPPGATVNLIDPVTLSLDAGTYTITNGALSGYYSGWNFSSGWVWSYGITSDNGDGTGNVFYVGFANGIYGSQSAAASGHGGDYGGLGGPTVPLLDPTGGPDDYSASFTLLAPTTLDFFTLDYYPYDNAGGVALNISSSDSLAVAEPPTWALLLPAFAALGFLYRRKSKRVLIAV